MIPFAFAGTFQVCAGDSVPVTAAFDEINITVAAGPGAAHGNAPHLEAMFLDEDEAGAASLQDYLQSYCSPWRTWSLNNKVNLPSWLAAIGTCAQRLHRTHRESAAGSAAGNSGSEGGPAVECVALGDSPLLALLCGLVPGVGSVKALQESSMDAAVFKQLAKRPEAWDQLRLAVEAASEAQASAKDAPGPAPSSAAGAAGTPPAGCANPPASVTAVSSSSYMKRLKRQKQAALEQGQQHQGQEGDATPPPLLLVSEPFYKDNEGMLPWNQLRFWNEANKIR